MPIQLTCPCGQRLSVANDLAGQGVTCAACGGKIDIPAMGVLLQPRAKSVPGETPHRLTSPKIDRALLAAGGVLLLLGMGGLVAWSVQSAARTGPIQVAEIVPAGPAEEKRAAAGNATPAKPEAPPNSEMEPAPREKPMPKPALERSQPSAPPAFEFGPKVTPPEPVVVPENMPAKLLEPIKLVWKLKEGDRFYQELIVTQKPTFTVQGVPIVSLLQYRIVSRFDVQKRDADGSLIVRQAIESAKLLQADELTRTTLAGSVARLPGTIYTLGFNAKMAVTDFQAAGEIKVKPIAGGLGIQMAPLLDRDGWKELAQATFFQMDEPLKANARWSKPMTHAWGALGSWSGKTNYKYLGPQEKLQKITYTQQMKHRAPAAGQLGGMTINSAAFQPEEADGVLFFDARRGKVVAAEERFRVKGVVNASLLGQNTLIEIREDQHFLIRIHDEMPAP